MELLLNLAWLLLALPAFWLWCKRHSTRRFSSLQALLALTCLLVILFPIVSATDDLRAMRAEMEELPVSKRALRQASTERSSLSAMRTPAVTVSCFALSRSLSEFWLQFDAPVASSLAGSHAEHPSRAPPAALLG